VSLTACFLRPPARFPDARFPDGRFPAAGRFPAERYPVGRLPEVGERERTVGECDTVEREAGARGDRKEGE